MSPTSSDSSDGTIPTSPAATRRTVLRTAGATLGVGLTVGEVAAADDATPSTVVGVSPVHRPTVEATLDRLSNDATAAITAETVETATGFRRFASGEIDVVVGSRPILSAERSNAVANDVTYESSEVPTGSVTLYAPGSAWTDCLRPASIAETWASDGPVETLAEVTSTGREPPRAAESAGGARSDGEIALVGEGRTLVRGVRSFQYATGFGGLGYYEPDEGWFEDGASVAAPTRLVRLASVYGDRTALDRRPTVAFLDAFARQSADAVGEVSYFRDPLSTTARQQNTERTYSLDA